MKQTRDYFTQQLIEMRDLARHQWKAFTAGLLIIIALFVASEISTPGWLTYFVMFPANMVIIVTAYARLNDMGPELMGWRWQVRRIGFVMVGVGIVAMLGAPFLEQSLFPTWRAVLLSWGLALSWLTTPNMVPWDWYIAGRWKTDPPPPDKPMSPAQRMVGRITGTHRVGELNEELRRRRRGEEE